MLRVLQNLRFTRLGGINEISLKARIIAASNSDLWEEVSQGNFREDLFYRLNVITIEIPPLRERKEELTDLIKHFCWKHSKKLNFNFNISDRALDLMKAYHWPGNVRELENVIERCAVLAFSRSDSCANEQDLLSYMGIRKALGAKPEPKTELLIPDGNSLKTMEKEMIKEVLSQTKGNITKAANLLGITRKTLYRKMDRHDLKVKL